jgi:hypothetical protein
VFKNGENNFFIEEKTKKSNNGEPLQVATKALEVSCRGVLRFTVLSGSPGIVTEGRTEVKTKTTCVPSLQIPKKLHIFTAK